MTEGTHGLGEALALTTNMLHDNRTGRPLTETLLMAREFASRGDVDEVLMAQSHLTITLLKYISEVAESAESAGVPIEGIPGGTTAENLLREFGRQMLEHQAGGGDRAEEI